MTKDEALKLALQFLESMMTHQWRARDIYNLKDAIKEALAQPEQEPVAYVKTVIEALYENSDPVSVEAAELLERITTSPQRKPLTHEMTKQMRESCDSYEMRGAFVDGWLSAEAAHGIKD